MKRFAFVVLLSVGASVLAQVASAAWPAGGHLPAMWIGMLTGVVIGVTAMRKVFRPEGGE